MRRTETRPDCQTTNRTQWLVSPSSWPSREQLSLSPFPTCRHRPTCLNRRSLRRTARITALGMRAINVSCSDPTVASAVGTCVPSATGSNITLCGTGPTPLFPNGTSGVFGFGQILDSLTCNTTEGSGAAFRAGVCTSLSAIAFRGFGVATCNGETGSITTFTDANCTTPRTDGLILSLNSTCQPILGRYGWLGSCRTIGASTATATATATAATSTSRPSGAGHQATVGLCMAATAAIAAILMA
ncbi:hypothetical protein DFJ74DRAFT_416585 [Hyaloraphidium curvatum]|nr:hypothetical protein DFJ74DRAFT_416585 [Hyaloraphidium curvatum]